MHNFLIHCHIDPAEPIAPKALALSSGTHTVDLTHDLCLFGPRDHLVRLLQAALDALSDGTVAWGPDGAEVVPLRRPGKRRVTIGVDDDQVEALDRMHSLYEVGPDTPIARLVADIRAGLVEQEGGSGAA